MSTRSGKRINSAVIENINNNVELQSVRKTRSKKQKENSDEVVTAIKKKNFVRRPSGDELESSNEKTQVPTKSSRKFRRQTLKELNVDIDSEEVNDKTSMRQSRRIRKVNVETVLNEEIIETKEKKKSKKKKVIAVENVEIEPEVIIPKKKFNKKKNKNSNSFIVEDVVPAQGNISLSKSNMSIDSFHSAAGSPVQYTLDNEDNSHDKVNRKKDKKTSSTSTCHPVENDKVGKKKNKKIDRSGIKEKSFETSESKIEAIDTEIETSFENKVSATLKIKSKKNKKSKGNNSINTALTFGIVDDDLNVIESEIPGNLNNSIKSSPQNKCIGIGINDAMDIASDSKSKIPDVNGIIKHSPEETPNSSKKRRKSSTKNSTINDIDTSITELSVSHNGKDALNETFTQETRKSVGKDTTYDKLIIPDADIDGTYDKCDGDVITTGKESLNNSRSSKRRSSIKNSTYDKIDDNLNATFDKEMPINSNSTYGERKSRPTISLEKSDICSVLNSTYDKITESTSTLNSTFDKPKLDSTFECNNDEKFTSRITSSIISSDNTNVTSDMSEDCSRISITSDDSRTEHNNIVNTTPLLIESSLDESQIIKTVTPVQEDNEVKNTPDETSISENGIGRPLERDGTYTDLKETTLKRQGTFAEESKPEVVNLTPTTPLKRGGTFTKDGPTMSPEVEKTPARRKSMHSPGHTPFFFSKSNSKEKSMLNVTHTIKSPKRRSSVAAAAPRLTRVMFRSPVDIPPSATLRKGKVIKSNLKGSNKSFVFDESVSELSSKPRKRSLTQGSEAGAAKRARLMPGTRSRAQTTIPAARPQDPGTPKKPATPAKCKPPRTKLPNFAALHQKHFGKMESLDECQKRKAKRAKQLLTPSTDAQSDATSPTGTTNVDAQTTNKPETPKAKEKTKSQNYTRFGFKLNLDVNPFSVPSTSAVKPKDDVMNQSVGRKETLPSLAGSTLRKEAARQAVMREKSFTDRRDMDRKENRTVIRGVRTNRRFELQMKMRNTN